MRSRSRSGSDATVARIIVLPMRPPALARLLPAAILLAAGCASRHGPMPSLEDYSDGTSLYAAALLEGWKAGAIPAEPAVAAADVERRPSGRRADRRRGDPSPFDRRASRLPRRRRLRRARPLSPSVSRRSAPDSPSLGRTEATIFDFARRGDRREILLGLFLSGRGRDGQLRQEGGKLRLVLAPAAGRRLADGVGLGRLVARRVLDGRRSSRRSRRGPG